MSSFRRLWLALTHGAAATSPDADDPRLRGRTYTVPFDRVWNEAFHLVGSGLQRWNVLEADDYDGLIRAEARSRLFSITCAVNIRISLDPDAQTRVDADATNRTGKPDLGTSARKLVQFFRALDRAVSAGSPAGPRRRARTEAN